MRPAIPYTAGELAGLRAAAEYTDAQGMTRRPLATVDRMRELSRSYLEARDRADPAAEREARAALEALL